MGGLLTQDELAGLGDRGVEIEGGRGGHAWPDPDERGAVLKGFGLARGVHLRAGEVLNLTPSFATAAVERQASYHPRSSVG